MRFLATFILVPTIALCIVTFASDGATENAADTSLKQRSLQNRSAYIPAQCYTKTKDEAGGLHNPCFVCHTKPRRPNYVNDSDLQRSYSFPEDARTNPWTNLFKDRREAIGRIDDEEMEQYVRTSNYFDMAGEIELAAMLDHVPSDWDYDGNRRWDGFVPDAWLDFDTEGFDRDPQGKRTGWRAFGYQPVPGTFWPTNGSTDDVLIRLPEAFRMDADGHPNIAVYKVNLAVIEAMLKEADVVIEPVDEKSLGGIDLDKDGEIGTADKIVYDWAPLEDRFMWYVGKAYELQREGKLHIAAGLYPEGTEFLHTVRYIDLDETGANHLARRMKEVRYARKRFWVSYSKLEHKADGEVKEKHDFPNRLRTVRGNLEAGVSNGQGWAYAGFIEDADGELRPQSYEELVFCVGCHGGVGANRDGVFSFHRKLGEDAFRHGWYHWSQKGLQGTPERLRQDGQPEYSFYLEQNASGNELGTNEEVRGRFFDSQGGLKPEMAEKLREDISLLLFASKERAMELNKAYRVIVREQSFMQGRDATLTPLTNVHRELKADEPTGLEKSLLGY